MSQLWCWRCLKAHGRSKCGEQLFETIMLTPLWWFLCNLQWMKEVHLNDPKFSGDQNLNTASIEILQLAFHYHQKWNDALYWELVRLVKLDERVNKVENPNACPCTPPFHTTPCGERTWLQVIMRTYGDSDSPTMTDFDDDSTWSFRKFNIQSPFLVMKRWFSPCKKYVSFYSLYFSCIFTVERMMQDFKSFTIGEMFQKMRKFHILQL